MIGARPDAVAASAYEAIWSPQPSAALHVIAAAQRLWCHTKVSKTKRNAILRFLVASGAPSLTKKHKNAAEHEEWIRMASKPESWWRN